MDYVLLKQVHVTAVIVSGTGFFLRGLLMLARSPLLDAYWVRRLPHAVDTVLLGSAIGLATTIHQYPFVHAWVSAKVLGLLTYIGLGMFALRRARTRGRRAACFIAALGVFCYVASVALTKNPWGFLRSGRPVLQQLF